MRLLRRKSSSFLRDSLPPSSSPADSDAPPLPPLPPLLQLSPNNKNRPSTSQGLLKEKQQQQQLQQQKKKTNGNGSTTPTRSKDKAQPATPRRPVFRRRSSSNLVECRARPVVTALDLLHSTTPAGHGAILLHEMYSQQLLARGHHHYHNQRARTPSLSDSPSSRASPDIPSDPENTYGYYNPSTHENKKAVTSHPKTPAKSSSPTRGSDEQSILGQPPSIVRTKHILAFVSLCFCVELQEVDFTQALKALDFLKELDDRRKREFCAALRRLNVDTATWDYEKQELQLTSPDVYDWIVGIEDKSRRIEALYTQVYIGLRRWILINEMRLQPFNKNNCSAMLDTLYPTNYTSAPTPQLTEPILNSQRSAFSRYIDAVECQGRDVLKTLENQSRRLGDANGWEVVRDIVEKYLSQTRKQLEDCTAVKGPEDLVPTDITMASHMRTDSGISLNALDPTWKPQRPSHAAVESNTPSRPRHGHSRSTSNTNNSGLSPCTPQGIRTRSSSRTPISRANSSSPTPAASDNEHFHHHNHPTTPDRKTSAIGRWARRFKSHSTNDASTDSRQGRRSVSQTRSSSIMGRGSSMTRSSSATGHEDSRRSHTPSRQPTNNTRDASSATAESSDAHQHTERVLTSLTHMGFYGKVIDDEHRERLIREAKKAREEKEKNKKNPSPTHFKLDGERKGRDKAEKILGIDLGVDPTGDRRTTVVAKTNKLQVTPPAPPKEKKVVNASSGNKLKVKIEFDPEDERERVERREFGFRVGREQRLSRYHSPPLGNSPDGSHVAELP